MAKQIDIELLDAFCEQLFWALDAGAGELFPWRLKEKPTAFEKYPRLLLGLIQRYDNVEAGFDEWATKTLRSVSDFHRDTAFQRLAELRSWLVKNRTIFEGRRDNLAHLKRSLYARVYAYLYPRRSLVVAYANLHRGDKDAFDVTVINGQFQRDVMEHLEEFNAIYDPETLQRIARDAQVHLVEHKNYYGSWK